MKQQRLEKTNPLVRKLRDYKSSVLNMESVEYTEFSPERGDIVEIKIDGELSGLYFDGKRSAFTISLEGRARSDFPVTEEAKRRLKRYGKCYFVGELYAVDESGKPLPYPDAISILRKPTPESEKRIKLAVFDVLDFQGRSVKDDYSDRFALIQRLFKKGRFVHPVLSGKSVKELWKLVEHDRYEGVVVRRDRVIKIKPKFSLDVAVIAITADEGKQMSAVHVALMDTKGNFRYIGKVGTGFKIKERPEWFKWAISRKVEGPSKGPFRGAIWVKPERVIKITYHRLNKRETPVLTFEKNRYKQTGVAPCITMAGRFDEVRTDKEVKPSDLRLEQIPGWKEMYKKSQKRELFDYDEWILMVCGFLKKFGEAAPIAFSGWEDMIRDYMNEFAAPLLMVWNLPPERRQKFLSFMQGAAEANEIARPFEVRFPLSQYEYDVNAPEVAVLDRFADMARSALQSGDFAAALEAAQSTLDYINSVT